MKKILCLLLAGVMVFAISSCSGSGENSGGSEPAATEALKPQKIAEDTTAVNMSFTPPEGYDTVSRHLEYAADGSVIDKSFSYKFSDKSEVMIGYSKGKKITDEIPQRYLDKAENVKYGGKSFLIVTQNKTLMGVCQDGDVIYGIGWSFADAVDRNKFNKIMEGIGFTDNTAATENDDDLYAIRYTLDSSLNVVSVSNKLTETSNGEAVDKSLTWRYGKDKDNIDFRLMIQVFKNTTVEKELPKDYKTGEVEMGGIKYTAVYDTGTAEKPFAYYTQHGSDVYQIRNMGKSGGWSVTRSDESYKALENLMKTVSFS